MQRKILRLERRTRTPKVKSIRRYTSKVVEHAKIEPNQSKLSKAERIRKQRMRTYFLSHANRKRFDEKRAIATADINQRLRENPRFADMSEEQLSKTRKWMNLATIVGIIGVIAICIWGAMNGYFTDREKLKALIDSAGLWGPGLFILLQIVQCVIPIIPGGVTSVMGVVIFGPWFGFLYNYMGIILGETVAFFIARIYGKSFVRALASEKTYDKYIGWLDKNTSKFEKVFFWIMFLPGMPDDVLCMIAGLTKMKFHRFLLILLISKPLGLLAYTLFFERIFTWITGLFA